MHGHPFYYDLSVPELGHTANPTGELDLSRLLAGKAKFWLERLSREVKKKHLILTNECRAACNDTLSRSLGWLKDCLGFTIYDYSGKSEVESSIVEDVAKAQGLSAEALYVLTPERLKSGIELFESLDVAELLGVCADPHNPVFFRFKGCEFLDVQRLREVLSDLSRTHPSAGLDLRDCFSLSPVTEDAGFGQHTIAYLNVGLTSGSPDERYQVACASVASSVIDPDKIEVLEIDDWLLVEITDRLLTRDLAKLKRLVIRASADNKPGIDLLSILTKCPQLVYLDIRNCKICFPEFAENSPSLEGSGSAILAPKLEQLSTIRWEGAVTSGEHLLHLMRIAPNLVVRVLDLRAVKIAPGHNESEASFAILEQILSHPGLCYLEQLLIGPSIQFPDSAHALRLPSKDGPIIQATYVQILGSNINHVQLLSLLGWLFQYSRTHDATQAGVNMFFCGCPKIRTGRAIQLSSMNAKRSAIFLRYVRHYGLLNYRGFVRVRVEGKYIEKPDVLKRISSLWERLFSGKSQDSESANANKSPVDSKLIPLEVLSEIQTTLGDPRKFGINGVPGPDGLGLPNKGDLRGVPSSVDSEPLAGSKPGVLPPGAVQSDEGTSLGGRGGDSRGDSFPQPGRINPTKPVIEGVPGRDGFGLSNKGGSCGDPQSKDPAPLAGSKSGAKKPNEGTPLGGRGGDSRGDSFPHPDTANLTSIRFFNPSDYLTRAGLQRTDKTVQGFVDAVFHAEHSCLVRGDSSPLSGFRSAFWKRCRDGDVQCYYATEPDDLLCSRPTLVLQKDNTGSLKKGPSGPLYDFIEANRTDDGAIILVDLDRGDWGDDDVINALNPALDCESRVDGILLGKIRIVMLFNPKRPGAYCGTDFQSRPRVTIELPPSLTGVIGTRESEPTKDPVVIDMEGISDRNGWLSVLFGHWQLNGNLLTCGKGQIQPALEQGSHVVFNNPPKGPEFSEFLTYIGIKGYCTYYGRIVPIREDFTYSFSYGCKLDSLAWQVLVEQNNDDSSVRYYLNSGLLPNWCGTYVCESGQLKPSAGYIKESAGQVIRAILTQELSDTEWARLFRLCISSRVRLSVSVAQGVYVPLVLRSQVKVIAPTLPRPVFSFTKMVKASRCVYVQSRDDDLTAAMVVSRCQKQGLLPIVITCAEITLADLGSTVGGQLNLASMEFEFYNQLGVLPTELAKGRTVILHGLTEAHCQWLPWFIDTVFQNRKKYPGRLIVIGKNAQHFPTLEAIFNHDPNRAQFHEALDCASSKDPFLGLAPEVFDNKTFYELTAIQRLSRLPSLTGDDESFDKKRSESVLRMLECSPWVFVHGKSGSGKSTMLPKILKTHGKLHQGEEALKAWAEDKSENGAHIYLLLDEANFRQPVAKFRDLANKPPSVVIANQYYELTDWHRVVFVGNKECYGGGRREMLGLMLEPYAVEFEPYPLKYLDEEIIRPVMKECGLVESCRDAICQQITAVFEYLYEISGDRLLVTPREAIIMIQHVACMCGRDKNPQPEDVARYFVYAITKGFVPKKYIKEYKRRFQFSRPGVPLSAPMDDYGKPLIVLNDTNRSAFDAVVDALMLWRYRKQYALARSKAGVILEGPPGVGKTELVLAALRHTSYKDEEIFFLSASMPLNEKRAALGKAFKDGRIIVANEFNTDGLPEKIWIEYLDQYPNALVLATQNPASLMVGRKVHSPAILHRLGFEYIGEYSLNEARHIILQSFRVGLYPSPCALARLLKAFYSKPECCFRDLLTAVRLLSEDAVKQRRVKTWTGHCRAVVPTPPIEIDELAAEPNPDAKQFGRERQCLPPVCDTTDCHVIENDHGGLPLPFASFAPQSVWTRVSNLLTRDDNSRWTFEGIAARLPVRIGRRWSVVEALKDHRFMDLNNKFLGIIQDFPRNAEIGELNELDGRLEESYIDFLLVLESCLLCDQKETTDFKEEFARLHSAATAMHTSYFGKCMKRQGLACSVLIATLNVVTGVFRVSPSTPELPTRLSFFIENPVEKQLAACAVLMKHVCTFAPR